MRKCEQNRGGIALKQKKRTRAEHTKANKRRLHKRNWMKNRRAELVGEARKRALRQTGKLPVGSADQNSRVEQIKKEAKQKTLLGRLFSRKRG